MKYGLAGLVCLCVLLPLPVLGSGAVVFSEIAWMGSLPKTGETASQAANNEWIELKNTASVEINLGGWKLIAQDGTPDIDLTGAIPASGFFLLERTSDDTIPGVQADQIYVGALSNSGERLFLKTASGEIVNEINALSGWPAGDNDTKQTMQFVGSAWLTASSTPRAENGTTAASPSPKPENPVSDAHSQGGSGQTPASVTSISLPAIKVYAGEDRIVAVGSLTEFLGEALDPKNEPLVNPRFWWNFGDGASKEGRIVSHIFQAPGKYTVGMHISSGSDARSDYMSVTVVPNQIKVKSVLMGEEGYLILFNPADAEIDIGEWTLEDGSGKKFILPSKTKIGAKSEISLANRLTGILRGGAAKATIRYPNSFLVVEWSGETLESGFALPVASPGPRQALKTALLPKESLAIATTATATAIASRGLARISNPSGNFSSKIFFFSAFMVSFVAAISYLFVKFFLK